MTATNFSAENRTYRQLVGNGTTYHVPRFQRDYSWGEEEWADLWADLLDTLDPDGEPAHYMGYLVLQTQDNRTFEVIDGPQRMTTLSLLVLAAMRLLQARATLGPHPDADKARLDQLRATYIGYLDPVTLTARNKLQLNRNNDPYYRSYLAPLHDHLPQRGFPASTHAMRKAFTWFEERLREKTASSPDVGQELARFIDTMSDRLFFTVITVSDQLNAYRVFETLNARGVRLSSTDLLKNYLFSVLARGDDPSHELDELEERWTAMVGRLGSEGFPDFMRSHWNSRHRFARKAELFKKIRVQITSREQVFALMRAMDEDVDAYLALTQPEGSNWPAAWRQSAGELRLFSVRQPFPMLMAARRRLSDDDFGKLLRATVVLSFRYNVIGSQPPSDQEARYHDAAIAMERGEATTAAAVLAILRPLYRTDDQFQADFADKRVVTTPRRNHKLMRYILASLDTADPGRDPDAPELTLEHVLPQRPGAGWESFADRDLESFVFRDRKHQPPSEPTPRRC